MLKRRWRISIIIIALVTSACAHDSAPNAAGPGWTGSTVVPGNNSTVASDAEATYQQQRWPFPRP
jgi:hypothetical protein